MTEKLYGLVLAGGESRRMQRDKALLDYHGQPQLVWSFELLQKFCADTFISVRADQHDPVRDGLPRIDDQGASRGPAGGLLAARDHAATAWLALACDLPFLSEPVLAHLIASRDRGADATAYRSAHDGLPEPLCAIWEPAGLERLARQVNLGKLCPRKTLINANTKLLAPFDAMALDNVNTPHEHAAVLAGLAGD